MAMPFTASRVSMREMQADPEHQQDHADFRELGGDARVADETRRKGPQGHAGQQIAHDRRQPQRVARNPKAQARTKPIATSAMSAVS